MNAARGAGPELATRTLVKLDQYMAAVGYAADHPWRCEIGAALGLSTQTAEQQGGKSVATDVAWTIETTAFFGARLDEMVAVLTMLISNVSEYSKGDGHATDEALVLANQLLLSTCVELEKLSYEYMTSPQVSVGNLSLYLMWARSLLEILDEMFNSDSWEIHVTDQTLAGYFGAVKRQVDRACHEAANMQFQEGA